MQARQPARACRAVAAAIPVQSELSKFPQGSLEPLGEALPAGCLLDKPSVSTGMRFRRRRRSAASCRCYGRAASGMPTGQPGVLGAEVAMLTSGLEPALQRSRSKDEKVEMLMDALDELQAASSRTPLQVVGAAGGGEGLRMHHAFMEASTGAILRLAAEHGVYEELGKALDERCSSKAEGFGSGLDGAPLERLTCANVDVASQRICKGPASFVCAGCRLVAYCSRDCQLEHRAAHKVDCKSQLAAEPFVPRWLREQRRPSFIRDDESTSVLGRIGFHAKPRQFLWGNTPAFCLVPKAQPAGAPEQPAPSSSGGGASSGAASGGTAAGSLLSQPVSHLCFAASGDLRNMIATVNGLDHEHKGKVVIHINDRDSTIMARNLAMLLLLFKEGPEAADAVIQLWYSTAVTSEQRMRTLHMLGSALGTAGMSRESSREGFLTPMPARLLGPDGASSAVCLDDLLKGSSPGFVEFDLQAGGESAAGSANGEGGNGAGGSASAAGPRAALKVDFEKQVWATLLGLMGNRTGLQELMSSRAQVVRDPAELDKRDRWIAQMHPHHRVSWCEFFDQGMLLPFGALNGHHNTANTFLFHPTLGYTLGGGSDPLHGWPLPDVMRAGERHAVPSNDLYGALFFYLREQLGEFASRLGRMDLEFRLTALFAEDLAPRLQEQGVMLDFIDASNIGDVNYCGIARVLLDWGPLLNWRANPDATLVTLFMNFLADMPEMSMSACVPEADVERLITKAVHTMSRELPSALREDMQALSLAEEGGRQGGRRTGRGSRGGRGGRGGGPGGPRPSDAALSAISGLSDQTWDIIKEQYDYGPVIQRYLRRKGALHAAARVGLAQRGLSGPHRIVPPRFFVPLGAPQSALPFQEGMSQEEIYLARRFSGATLVERYIEWVGAPTVGGGSAGGGDVGTGSSGSV